MRVVLAEFSAPWSRSLRTSTTVSVLVLLGVMAAAVVVGPRLPLPGRLGLTLLPVLIVLGTLPFMVRGYVLTDKDIEVRRLGWRTMVPLAGLTDVTGLPQGLAGSVRLFGNGGMFAVSGWFWNRRIGRYRAYVTDPARAVLLRYRDGAQVVLTPHDVQHFIVKVKTLAASARGI
jgi:Bacterial PH domain